MNRRRSLDLTAAQGAQEDLTQVGVYPFALQKGRDGQSDHLRQRHVRERVDRNVAGRTTYLRSDERSRGRRNSHRDHGPPRLVRGRAGDWSFRAADLRYAGRRASDGELDRYRR